MCTAVVGGSIHRAATSSSAASSQRDATPMPIHRAKDRRGDRSSPFRNAVLGCISGLSVTSQNNRLGRIIVRAESPALPNLAQPPRRIEIRHFYPKNPKKPVLLTTCFSQENPLFPKANFPHKSHIIIILHNNVCVPLSKQKHPKNPNFSCGNAAFLSVIPAQK